MICQLVVPEEGTDTGICLLRLRLHDQVLKAVLAPWPVVSESEGTFSTIWSQRQHESCLLPKEPHKIEYSQENRALTLRVCTTGARVHTHTHARTQCQGLYLGTGKLTLPFGDDYER